MNTKEDILIFDVMSYTDKKTGEIKSRIGFTLCNEKHFKSTDKFVGFSELSCFYDGNILSKIPKEVMLEVVTGVFEVRTNASNPMRTSSILSAIEYDGDVYRIL